MRRSSELYLLAGIGCLMLAFAAAERERRRVAELFELEGIRRETELEELRVQLRRERAAARPRFEVDGDGQVDELGDGQVDELGIDAPPGPHVLGDRPHESEP